MNAPGAFWIWFGVSFLLPCGLVALGALLYRRGAEAALRRATRAEHERDVLVEAQSFSHTGTWEVDLATGLGTWSEEMYQICGLVPPPEGVPEARQREDLLRVFHPHDRLKLMQATEKAAKDLKPFEVDHRVCWPDGSVRWCISRGRVIVGMDGKPAEMVGATQDVTERARMEESLRDAEARFIAFMNHSPFSAWMRDASGQFVYCNDRFSEYMGLLPHEVVGSDAQAAWLSREYVEKSQRDDQKVLTLGRAAENIEHVPLRDGSIRHWLVLKFPIQSHSGETYVGGVSLDLSARYEAEEKLRASEKRLRSVMQSASDGIAAADSEGKVVSWNHAAEKMFGYTEEEILGLPLTRLLSEEGRHQYEFSATNHVEGIPLVLRGRRKSGEEFALELSRSSWRSGTQTFVTAILRDVTERNQIEEQLRLSEAHMRMTLDAALDAVPQIVWTSKPDGTPSFFNRKWFEYVGVSFPQLNEHGWLAWVHPDDLEAASNAWKQALKRAESCEMQYRLRRGSDGSYRWHISRALPVRDDSGRVVQWFGTSTDIHDHKMAQEEQARLRAREAAALETSRLKSEFLAHMSHEIRTPINGVIGMADLLMDTKLDQDQHVYADAIHRSANALLGIINDILDFSKIEAGKLEIERIDFDLARVFEDAEKTLIFQARAKGLELIMELAPKVPTLLQGDPGRLRQVLGNLVSNAIKFTSEGKIVVRAAKQGSPGRDGRVVLRFEVTDTGIGIAKSAQARMFQPFQQADSSTSRFFGGTGLGLSICKRLVEQMGGEIGVSSALGRGSTFWFTIPFTPGAREPVAEAPRGPVRAIRAAKGARVLVAEDNQINQTIILKQLEKMGLKADAVVNGREALAALERERYDLVLMDCQMPGMDGYEATARIRASHGAFREVPIIALTANAITGDREKCLALGMNDYLSKPIRPREFGRVLSKWLRESRAAQDAIEAAEARDGRDAEPSSAIDPKTVEELIDLDDGKGDVLRQLVQMFTDGGADRIGLLKKALSAGDLKAIASEAHSFRSSAANLGANRMSELCRRLEHSAGSQATSALPALVEEIEAEFAKASGDLQRIVASLGKAA